MYFGRTSRHVGSQFPDQGSNPCPLQWKFPVLTNGPAGKSLMRHLKAFLFNLRSPATPLEAKLQLDLCYAQVFECSMELLTSGLL